MASAIQVNGFVYIAVLFICFYTCSSAIEVGLSVPSNAQEKYYVTKLGCSAENIELDSSGNDLQFDRLFSVLSTGDLVLKQSAKQFENSLFVVSVKRWAEYDICLDTHIPNITKLFIEIKNPTYFLTDISTNGKEIHGHVDLASSTKVQGEDLEYFFKSVVRPISTQSSHHSVIGADIFKITKLKSGDVELHLSEFGIIPSFHFYHMIYTQENEDGRILYTNIHVTVIRETHDIKMSPTIMRNKSDKRKPSLSTDHENGRRAQGHYLTASFDQEKIMKDERPVRRFKRQTVTTSTSVEVPEGATGELYDFSTATNAGSTFELIEAVPDVVRLTNGKVFLKDGQTLDYDNSFKAITVEVEETQNQNGATVNRHTLTITITDVNDEVPKFTNVPSPFLARVDPWAAIGTPVYLLTALDVDSGSILEFHMEGSSNYFEVVTSSGQIRTKAGLTQNLQEDIVVFCNDTAAPTIQLSEKKTVSITTNYRAPQFYETQYLASFPENAQTGHSFQDSSGIDVALQTVNFQNGDITYTILNPNSQQPSSLFSIQDGKLVTMRTFDHEQKPQYALSILARDSVSEMTSTVSLTVTVQDVNEYTPEFTHSPYHSAVSESLVAGNSVLRVTAVDRDTSSDITYSVSDDRFTIVNVENNVGEIRVSSTGVLDYETAPDHMYTFIVTAVDDGGITNIKRSSTASVIISLINANDLAPQFVQTNWEQKILDDADWANATAVKKIVLHVQAYDEDNDGITYSFGNGNHNIFDIDGNSGLITLKTTADIIPANTNTFIFEVLAADDNTCCSGGSPTPTPHTSTATVTIFIIDHDNPKPTLNCPPSASVMEEMPVGTPIITVHADSHSRYGYIEYSLRQDRGFNALEYFAIDKMTGNLTTLKVLDREDPPLDTMFVTVQATNRGDPPLSDLCTFPIRLDDTNDQSPTFTSTNYVDRIYRDATVGTAVFAVLATDNDIGQNAQITYSFESSDDGVFSFRNNTSGIITLERSLTNKELGSKINLTVIARDGGATPKSSTASITLTVQNDVAAPVVPVSTYSFQMSETMDTNSEVGEVTVQSNNVKVEILNFGDYFGIRQKNGTQNYVVFNNYVGRILYEARQTYQLLVRVSIQEQLPTNSYMIVTVNMEDANMQVPEFIGRPFDSPDNFDIKLEVPENSPVGEAVGRVKAIDGDYLTPAFSLITYTVAPVGSNQDNFTIEASTGIIKTKNIFNADEGSTDYFFTIIAKDGAVSSRPQHDPPGTPNSAEATVQIQISDVNDNPPQFTGNSFSFSVPENAALLSRVGAVIATDKDKAPVLRFTLSNKEGGARIPFAVNWTTGVIYVSGHLDFETKSQYSLSVRVFDGRFADTADVTITVTNVNDIAPTFSESLYTFTNITEGDYTSQTRLLIGQLTAADRDSSSSSFRYSILTEPWDQITNSVFSLEQNTGNLYVIGNLERDGIDGKAVYEFAVSVIDEPTSDISLRGYAVVQVLPLDQNDNAPQFDQDTLEGSVYENSVTGTTVMTVVATDADAAANGEVTYSLNDLSTFSIDNLIPNNGGVIRTVVILDRENNDKFEIEVVAADGATGAQKKSTTGMATIWVLDRNDNSPQFNETLISVTIKETDKGEIVALYASDLDAGDILTYSVSAADFTHFGVEKSGDMTYLIVHNSPDFDTGEVFFNVTVTVSDGVNTDTCYVAVTVLDVNDNAPNFTSVYVYQGGNFSENTAVDTIIANFTAEDADSNENKMFEFFILLESDLYKYFKLESTSTEGKILVNKPLDRETVPVFNLTVLAIDEGSPPQTGTAIIKITLEDVNDNGPVLQEDSRTLTIKENQPATTGIKVLYAEDPDSADNGPPFNFLQPVCDANSPGVCNKFSFTEFTVSQDIGEALRVNSLTALDREEYPKYFVNIVISDQHGVSATSTLTIIIEDENDNPQEDATQNIFVYNYKGLFGDMVIGLTGFNDPDGIDDRDDKTFRKKTADYTDNYVSVAADGSITLLPNVPYGNFEFDVEVIDNNIKPPSPVSSRTSTTTVRVTVEELDEQAPYKAGSVRISGMTAADFVSSPNSNYDKFRQKLAEKLYGTQNAESKLGNVQIVTLNDSPVESPDKYVDVRFAAHGSPYYSPARMNGIVREDKTAFAEAAGGEITMVGIDECLKESCEGGCWNELIVEDTPNVVNAGTVTKVGVTSRVEARCGCRTPVSQTSCTPDYCFNEGRCVQDVYGLLSCECKVGFDGPRCQNTKKGFSGTGYAFFKPLEQCLRWELSIEFITLNTNGIIMYNGPMETPGLMDPVDYLVLQLRNGYPELKVDLGTGELSLYIDNSVGASTLNDGKWHHISIVKDGKMITMTVDYCKTATSPDSGSAGDRSSCEASGYTKSTHRYLNVNGPLQLGGRSPTSPSFPSGVIDTMFDGCMRNLRHKGELYDLQVGNAYTGVTDTCEEEEAACGNKCGNNGECRVTDISSTPMTSECICDRGYRGSSCDIATSKVDFRANSFMEWSFTSAFVSNVKETRLQLMYRSRDQEGVLFHLSSQAPSEFIRLQIIDNVLQLAYNLGGGQYILAMPGVVASDGQWHNVTVIRVGKAFVMKMDGGEGNRYVTTQGPMGGQEEIALMNRQVYAGAVVAYQDISSSAGSGTYQSMDFNSSCYNDIRLETYWFPMTQSESNSNEDITLDKRESINDGCERNDCLGVTCPPPFICTGLWEAYACVCPPGKEEINGACVDIDYCKDGPCMSHATCSSVNGSFFCLCPAGWRGIRCNQLAIKEPEQETNNAGLIAGIVVAVVLALIIVFIIGFFVHQYCRKKDDMANLVEDEKEDYDIRENVVAYDEEGAGEDDHEGYDLSRLRKPMDMTRMDKPTLDMANERPLKSGPPQGPGIGEFIGDRLGDADDDPNAPPFDTVMELNYEGGGSSAGSLSSLNTSSSGGDQDYDYLNNWGPKFAKLADMYNQYEDSD